MRKLEIDSSLDLLRSPSLSGSQKPKLKSRFFGSRFHVKYDWHGMTF